MDHPGRGSTFHSLGRIVGTFAPLPLKNPFVRPVNPLERFKAAQVCPYCFAQVYTMWGKDLRVHGRCPECKKRIYRYRSVMLSRRDVLLFVVAYAAVALAITGLFAYMGFFS